MAKLTDLSNEIILAIRSHLRKPADILRFAFVDRRCHGLITPLLYQTIVLHHKDYLSIDPRYSDRKLQRKLQELVSTQQGPFVRNLEICAALGYHIGYRPKQFNLFHLLSNLTNLTSLCLRMLREDSIFNVFPVWLLPYSLGPASGNLRSLVLCIEGRADDDVPIGSLQKLTALKHLCIQSSVLLGSSPTDDEITQALADGDVLYPRRTMASEVLPASLESLELHCCQDGNEFGDDALAWYVDRGQLYACELSLFVGKAVNVQRRLLKSVLVCRSLLKGCGKRVRDLREQLDVVGTKTSHLGVELKFARRLEDNNARILSIV